MRKGKVRRARRRKRKEYRRQKKVAQAIADRMLGKPKVYGIPPFQDVFDNMLFEKVAKAQAEAADKMMMGAIKKPQ